MVIGMENKYLLVAVIAVATAIFAVNVASAYNNDNKNTMMGMMSGDFAHDQGDIDWMREEMKEHMGFTDEEFDEMVERCPMMRSR